MGIYAKKITPYRMLRAKDVMHVKGGNQKLLNIKSLVKQVIRAAVIANRHDFFVQKWYPRKVMDLYLGFRHLCAFSCLYSDKKRRYETIFSEDILQCVFKTEGKNI